MSRPSPDRTRRTGAVVTAALLALGGCSSDTADGPAAPTSVDGDAGADPDSDPDADPEADPPPTALSPPAERAEPLPEDETDPRGVGTPSGAAQASGDFPRWAGDPLQLEDARLIALGTLDRLVLEFDGPLPSWQVVTGTGPLLEQPGRSEVQLAGDSRLEIRLVPVTSIDRDAGEPMASYEGPSHLVSEGDAIREAVLTGDSSDILVWGVGVAGTPSFAVGTLEDPDRLVIDVFDTAG